MDSVSSPWSGSSEETSETNGMTASGGASEPVGVGIKCEVKNLYEGPVSRYGDTNWVDKYPDDLAKPAETAETACYALLVRNRRNTDNSKKLLVIDSMVVQSPFLKSVLGSVLEGYPESRLGWGDLLSLLHFNHLSIAGTN